MVLTVPIAALGQAKDPAEPPKKAATVKLPSAREIIDKHVKAIGGREAILKHTSTQAKGKFEIPSMGVKGNLEVNAAKPNKLWVRVELPGLGEILNGFDGKVGWSSDPATGPMVLEGKQLEEVRARANYYSTFHDEKDFKSMETVELTRFEGIECYKLKLVRQSGQEVTEFFDAKTGLQAGQTTTQESSFGAVPVTSVVTDYKPFDGVLIGTRITQKLANIEQVMITETVEHNKVVDSAFELPPKIKALLNK